MKAIIQRNLPLNVKYVLIDKKYIPLENGVGCGCDNCGKLIANIATVKNTNGSIYNIGFDCLETILINNSLLSTNDIQEYELVKKMIPKVIRFSKSLKETIQENRKRNVIITGLKFEKPSFGDWYTFYYLTNHETNSRNNDSIKIKDLSYGFLIETLINIFPNLDIISEFADIYSKK